ncbi:MAG: penicillin-binding transpeptidase domain-containing protein [Christensenellales bacterium]|jgi:peptidoglycan glycosyltransferase
MKRLRRYLKTTSLAIVAMLVSLVVFGAYNVITQGNRWFSSSANTHLRERKADAIPGNIYDRSGNILATTDVNGKRVYHSDERVRRAMVHVLGDRQNNVGYGVESFMANELYGFDTSPFIRLAASVKGEKMRGNNLLLSVDVGLSSYISSIFPKNKKGACVVMNYKTGEIISLLSFPNFDPDNITEETKRDKQRPFWNNATRWVSAPGSTFKIITLSAALQNIPDVQNEKQFCDGLITFPSGKHPLVDAGKARHGEISLKDAFAKSCNITFGSLALQMGDEALKNTASQFGIGDYFLFKDFVVENSVYPKKNRTTSEVAWTGVGQSAIQISPLHMCMIASSVANDGNMMEPQLLLRSINSNNEVTSQFSPKVYKRSLSRENAAIIKEYMHYVIQKGTGTGASVPGKKICGKTGSAEIDGQKETNSWFAGFSDEPNYPYALCVVVMDAGGGGKVAAPIAGKIFKAIFGQI